MKKFKKGDNIKVISGNDKGKIGKIISTNDKKVIISGVNVRKIHKKPKGEQPGEIIKLERPIHISNISHIDENNKASKISFLVEDGEDKKFKRKSRILKTTGKKLN